MFKQGDTLTLVDDKEYVVVDTYTKNGKIFVYLVDIDDNTNIIYGMLENDEIVEITNPDLLEDMIKTVNDNLHKNA